MELNAILVGGAVLALALLLFWRSRQGKRVDAPTSRPPGSPRDLRKQELDIVGAWPPTVTRALTGGEREAREALIKALPECMILAQVPLARFLKVPRRNSYTEWLTRAGYMSADLLVCDRTSLVLAVVSLQTDRESSRAVERRAVMSQILKAAGVKLLTWREGAIPSPDDARAMIERRVDVKAATKAATTVMHDEDVLQPGRAMPRSIPVPEVVALDMSQLEPQSSTWFDELDSRMRELDGPNTTPGAFDDRHDRR